MHAVERSGPAESGHTAGADVLNEFCKVDSCRIADGPQLHKLNEAFGNASGTYQDAF